MEPLNLTEGWKEKKPKDKDNKSGFLFLQLPRSSPKSPQSESQLSPSSSRSPTSPNANSEISISLDELSPQGVRRPSFSSIALSEPDTVRTTRSRPVSQASTTLCQPILQNSATSMSGATLTNSNRTNSHKAYSHYSPKKPSRIKSRLEAYKESIAQRRPFEKFDSRQGYRPFWLRPWSILFLLVACFTLIGLIEFMRKTVPTLNGGTTFPNYDLGENYFNVFGGGKPIYNDRAVASIEEGGEGIAALDVVEEEQGEEEERPPIERRVLSEDLFPGMGTTTYVALRAMTMVSGPPNWAHAPVPPTLDTSDDCVEMSGYCRIVAVDDPNECQAVVKQWAEDNHPLFVTNGENSGTCLDDILDRQVMGECKYFYIDWNRPNALNPGGWMGHRMTYRRGVTKRCARLGVEPEEGDTPDTIIVSDTTLTTITTEVGGPSSAISDEPSSTPPSPGSSVAIPGSSASSTSPAETSPAISSSGSPTASSVASSAASSSTSPTVTPIGGSTITTETVVTVPVLTLTRDKGGNIWLPLEPNSTSVTATSSEITLTQTDDSGSETVVTTVVPVTSSVSSSSSSNNTLPITVVPLIDPTKGSTTGSITQTLIYFNDTSGSPTLTLAKFVTERVETLRTIATDPSGSPYATQLLSTQTRTEYLTRPGVPNASPKPEVAPPAPFVENETSDLAHPVTRAGYFLGAFGPVLLAVLLGIPIGILNMHVKRMAPFMMLSRGYTSASQTGGNDQIIGGGEVPDSREVTARDSLLLSIEGIYGPLRSIRLLWTYGFAAGFLGDLLMWCSGLLVAVSKDVLFIETMYWCKDGGGNNSIGWCFMYLSMRLTPMRAAEALLIFMACLMLGLGWIFWRWNNDSGAYYKTLKDRILARQNSDVVVGGGGMPKDDGRVRGNGGVMMRRNPWSLAGVVGLLASSSATSSGSREGGDGNQEGLKGLLKRVDTPVASKEITRTEMAKSFEGWKFALRTEPSNGEVGIRMIRDPAAMPGISSESPEAGFGAQQQDGEEPPVARRQILGSTTYWNFDLPALVLHAGLLTLILYYQQNHYDTSFERWMNSDTFGVHFLFSGLGFLIGLFWDGLFSRVARLSTYRRLAQEPQTAWPCILEAPSTNVWTGLGRSIRRRDPFSAVVAFSGVLAKFTPILLANIPYSSTVTWTSHQVCTWMSVSILTLMVVVLIFSLFFINWPYMPVETDTIAGAMYYVCDSAMLGDAMEGQLHVVGDVKGPEKGVLGGRSRTFARDGVGATAKYHFRKTVGVSGKQRIAVDYAPGARSEVV